MDEKIDVLDYAIMKCIESEGTLWKKKIYDWLEKHQADFPRMSGVSLQTVGRHVEALRKAGLLESRIVSTEELRRDMIIGYVLTPSGQQAMAKTRKVLLRREVMAAGDVLLTGNIEEMDVERDALINLFCDEFDINDSARTEVLPHCETQEIVALLAIHYFANSVEGVIRTDEAGRLAELAMQAPKLRESLMQETVIDRIRRYVREGTPSYGAGKRMWGIVS